MAKETKFDIAAEDKASQTIADVTKQLNGLVAAGDDVSNISFDKITSDIGDMADTAGRLEVLAVASLGVAAAFEIVKSAVAAFEMPVDEFIQWEAATQGLIDSQIAFAENLERVIGVQSGTAATVLGMATNYGIWQHQLDDVTATAFGLAETLNINVNTALHKTSEFLLGNEKALDTLIPGLRNLETAELRLTEVERLAAEGLAAKAERMQGVEGAQLRYEASLRRLYRIIGEGVSPAVTVLFNSLASIAELVENSVSPAFELLHRDFDTFMNDLASLSSNMEFFQIGLIDLEKQALITAQSVLSIFKNFGIGDLGANLNPLVRDLEERQERLFGKIIAKSIREAQEGADRILRDPLEIERQKPVLLPDLDIQVDNGDSDKKRSTLVPELRAAEGRLLTRGRDLQSEAQQETAKSTKQVAGNLKQLHEDQKKWQEANRTTMLDMASSLKNSIKVEFIS